MNNPDYSLVENFNNCYPGVDLTYSVHEAPLPDPQQELVNYSYKKKGEQQQRQSPLTRWCFIEHTEFFIIAAVKRDLGLPG